MVSSPPPWPLLPTVSLELPAMATSCFTNTSSTNGKHRPGSQACKKNGALKKQHSSNRYDPKESTRPPASSTGYPRSNVSLRRSAAQRHHDAFEKAKKVRVRVLNRPLTPQESEALSNAVAKQCRLTRPPTPLRISTSSPLPTTSSVPCQHNSATIEIVLQRIGFLRQELSDLMSRFETENARSRCNAPTPRERDVPLNRNGCTLTYA
jgi:hypothetical protein